MVQRNCQERDRLSPATAIRWGSSSGPALEGTARRGGHGAHRRPRRRVLRPGTVSRMAGDKRCPSQLKGSNLARGRGQGAGGTPGPASQPSVLPAPSPPTAPAAGRNSQLGVCHRRTRVSAGSFYFCEQSFFKRLPSRPLPLGGSPDERRWHAWKLRLPPARQPRPKPSSSSLPSRSTAARQWRPRYLAEGQMEPGPAHALGSRCSASALGRGGAPKEQK